MILQLYTARQVRIALLIMLFTASIISLPLSGDSTGKPFGGQITTFFPGCLFPRVTALTIGPPTPEALIYAPGISRSYRYGPPTVPGQWLLGMAGPYVPCIVLCGGGFGGPTPCPYTPQPGGLQILYHGSSHPSPGGPVNIPLSDFGL